MSVMREELHHLVDQLSEKDLRPTLELIRGRLEEHEEDKRDLPFFSSFAADEDLAQRYKEILRTELGH